MNFIRLNAGEFSKNNFIILEENLDGLASNTAEVFLYSIVVYITYRETKAKLLRWDSDHIVNNNYVVSFGVYVDSSNGRWNAEHA